MIASFLAIGLIFRINTRVVQTYLEVVKTIIIAVFIRNMSRNSWWVFAIACVLSCMIFVSVPETLIYNVPSIIGGCTIGIQKDYRNKIINYVVYFIVNTILISYEFVMFGLFMGTNLFDLYKDDAAVVLSEVTGIVISESLLQVIFILFMLFDSAATSFVIFVLTQIILKRLDKINNSK